MQASVVDLRYRMKDVLKALERNERVSILCHGKVKGTILPPIKLGAMKVSDHPFFNMCSNASGSVAEQLEQLRGGRYAV